MPDSPETAVTSQPKRRVLIAVSLVVLVAVGLLMLLGVMSHYHVGRVEAIVGTSATIAVPELDETFTAEVVDPDLAEGAEVVLYVADGAVSIVATSPGRVRMIAALKELL